MITTNKVQPLLDHLRSEISSGRFSAGESLPPLRELSERFGISFSTAKRAIDQLQKLGLAEVRPQSGAYVKKVTRNSNNVNLFAVFYGYSQGVSEQGILKMTFLGIQKAAEELGCALELHFVPPATFRQDQFTMISSHCRGVLLLGDYDSCIKELNHQIPVIGIGMHNNYNGCISIAELDPILSAEQAADFFINRKVETVTIVTRENLSPAYLERAERVAAQLIKQGKSVKYLPFDQIEPDNMAYLFVTGSLMQRAAESYQKRNGCLPDLNRQTWLGIDGKHLVCPEYFAAPAIALNWQTLGSEAFHEVHYRAEHPGSQPKRMWLPGKLVK